MGEKGGGKEEERERGWEEDSERVVKREGEGEREKYSLLLLFKLARKTNLYFLLTNIHKVWFTFFGIVENLVLERVTLDKM